MAGLGNNFRESLLNWIRGTQMPTPPTTVYLSLHSADPGLTGANEITGTGYSRKAVTFSAPADDGADEMIANNATVTFGPAGAGGFSAAVTHVGLWLHETSTAVANFVGSGTTSNRTVNENDSYQYSTSNLKVKAR